MRRIVIFSTIALSAAFLTSGAPLQAVEIGGTSGAFPAVDNGDTNGDWDLDLSDVIYMLNYLYLGGPASVPHICSSDAALQNGDTNGDSEFNLTDSIYLLSHLFLGGPEPIEISCGAIPGGGAATQRPLSEFLSTQGTFCHDFLGDGTCFLFVPPSPNFLGWTNDTDTNNDGVQDKPLLFAGVDFVGLANGHFGDLFGTKLSGSVSERTLTDGRAEVSILVRAKRANGWVIALDVTGDILFQIADGPTLFGHRPEDVALGAEAALGDSFIHLVMINGAPGAALPDIQQLFNAPGPGQEVKSLRFLWRASGPLTELFGVSEGTPGRCTIQQNGVLVPGSSDHLIGGDGFPAEFINLGVIGR